MEFKLNEDDIKKLNEWKEKIKELMGEYGHYTYSFTPNGIGCEVKVRSHLINKELDLTDYDDF